MNTLIELLKQGLDTLIYMVIMAIIIIYLYRQIVRSNKF